MNRIPPWAYAAIGFTIAMLAYRGYLYPERHDRCIGRFPEQILCGGRYG